MTSEPQTARALQPGVLATVLAWALALALLGWSFQRVPYRAAWEALREVSMIPFLLFVAAECAAVTLADAFAMGAALRSLGRELPLKDATLLRGATYPIALTNGFLGYAGIGAYQARRERCFRVGAEVTLLLAATTLTSLVVVAIVSFQLWALDNDRGLLVWGWLGLVVIASSVVCALLLRPRLANIPVVGALATLPLASHASALGARLVWVAVVVLFHWGAFRVWGIPAPLGEGLRLVPLVLLVGFLPITPAGLGTVQMAHVALFAEWAGAPTAAEREAHVLAFSLAHHATLMLAMLLLSAACWWQLGREALRSDAQRSE